MRGGCGRLVPAHADEDVERGVLRLAQDRAWSVGEDHDRGAARRHDGEHRARAAAESVMTHDGRAGDDASREPERVAAALAPGSGHAGLRRDEQRDGAPIHALAPVHPPGVGERRAEPREFLGAREERAGGPRGRVVRKGPQHDDGITASRMVYRERMRHRHRGLERRRAHPERIEHDRSNRRRVLRARGRRDHVAREPVARARVRVHVAGRREALLGAPPAHAPRERLRVVRARPRALVHEAGGVGEQLPHGDVAQRRAEIAGVASDGSIEVERTARGELRRRERGDGLGDGADPHQGARRHRVAGLDAAHAERPRVRDASVAHDDHRGARRTGAPHLAREDRVQAGRGGRPRALGPGLGQHARRERGGGEKEHRETWRRGDWWGVGRGTWGVGSGMFDVTTDAVGDAFTSNVPRPTANGISNIAAHAHAALVRNGPSNSPIDSA